MRTGPSVEQLAKLDIETLGEPLDNFNRRVAAPSFEVTDIGAMDICMVRELLLRPVTRLPQATQVPGKAIVNIHAHLLAGMSTINLQTISYILT